jgi:hypothetical protein
MITICTGHKTSGAMVSAAAEQRTIPSPPACWSAATHFPALSG